MMHYIQVISGCSRWSRFMTDEKSDAADAECDDDCLPASAYHDNQTVYTTDRIHRKEAAPKYVWLALFLLVVML